MALLSERCFSTGTTQSSKPILRAADCSLQNLMAMFLALVPVMLLLLLLCCCNGGY